MTEEERMEEGAVMAPPVLAQVAVHPSGELIVWLNESVEQDKKAQVCLGIAQAFIGYSLGVLDEPRRMPQIIVPQMGSLKL